MTSLTQSKSMVEHGDEHPASWQDVPIGASHGKKSDGDSNTDRQMSGVPAVQISNSSDANDISAKHPLVVLMDNIFHCNAMKQTLLLANIGGWYYTNGMNGISMQAFAADFKGVPFMSICATTAVITCLQLLVGFLLGGSILWSMHKINNRNNSSVNENSKVGLFAFLLYFVRHSIEKHSGAVTQTKDNKILSALHAIGSLATNLGFMFGKASLVQVLKLLEPFETLVLSQVLLPTREGAGTCSSGIIGSMIVVVGAAMSLLKLQSTPPAPPAVIFAILSGLSLSCRNVLQRKQHTDKPSQQLLPKDNVESEKEESRDSSKPKMALEPQSKLERSIMQFTQLSLISALWTGAVAIALHAGLWVFLSHPTPVIPDIQVLIWHPLYNICSMITLGYVSALTHSLLNAGKRVVAIGMALIWFSEGLPLATVAGLLTVGLGGGWYSWESKQLKKVQQSGGNSNADWKKAFGKLFASLTTLQILLWIQHHH